MDDMEVKADALDGAFDAVLAAEAVDELKASVAALKAQVDAQAVAASRLPLDGAKAAADPARDAFVERYLRRGIDAGVEMKSLSGASGGEGGYAVPRQIDAAIARELTAISPIRAIAQVVQTGSAGYRKLVTTGGTADLVDPRLHFVDIAAQCGNVGFGLVLAGEDIEAGFGAVGGGGGGRGGVVHGESSFFGAQKSRPKAARGCSVAEPVRR